MDFIPPDNPYAFVPWLSLVGAALVVGVCIKWARAGKKHEAAGGKQDLDFAAPWIMASSGLALLAVIPLCLHMFWLERQYQHQVADVLVVAAADAYGVEVDHDAAMRLLTTEEPSRYGMQQTPLDLHPAAGETVSGFTAGVLFPDGMYRSVQLVFDGESWILVEPATVDEAVELTAP